MLSYYACCVTRESEFVYSHEADNLLRTAWHSKDGRASLLALPVEGEGRFVDLFPPTNDARASPWKCVQTPKRILLAYAGCYFRERKLGPWFLQVVACQTSPGTVSAFYPVGSISSTQILGARSPGRLNFVQWHLMFVVLQYGTSLLSLLWCLEFWGGS
jgi:hypothetical protein